MKLRKHPIPTNPVILFLKEVLASGKTTKEKICVACDLRYPTFDNVFFRQLVSPNIRIRLLHAGILPEKVYHAYEDWYRTVYQPTQKAKKNTNRYADQPQRESGGVEETSDRSPIARA